MRACMFVFAGSYNNVNGSVAGCQPCLAGLYTDTTGQTVCQDCPLGRFTNAGSQSQCALCDAGFFGNSTGLTICLGCEAGSVQALPGQVNCTQCVPGLYQFSTKQTVCLSCSPGGCVSCVWAAVASSYTWRMGPSLVLA